jgi:hypothetical protein
LRNSYNLSAQNPSSSHILLETPILHVVLYRHETWSLAIKEEHKFRAFENNMSWRIFWPKREEVRGNWGKFCNEELYNLYF